MEDLGLIDIVGNKLNITKYGRAVSVSFLHLMILLYKKQFDDQRIFKKSI